MAILVMWLGQFEQNYVPLSEECPYELLLNWPNGFRVKDVLVMLSGECRADRRRNLWCTYSSTTSLQLIVSNEALRVLTMIHGWVLQKFATTEYEVETIQCMLIHRYIYLTAKEMHI